MLNRSVRWAGWKPWMGALLLAGLLAAPAARAEHTRYWRQSSYEEFEKGTARGVALRSDGKLVLAPQFAAFADPNAAYLWTLRVDSKGRLYAAGGSDAKVLRLDADGKASTVFESQELSAQALAIDAKDNLYVGTSPDGKVYKVTPAGEKSVFFEPKTKYIWDMLVAVDGTLYVATGDTGKIFAVTPQGKGDVFYDSDEAHIRTLALDSRGNLLAGTEPNGLVLRIPTGTAGAERRAFVLYETEKKEITALHVDRAGNIYAAAVGDKRPTIRTIPVTPMVPQSLTGATLGQAGTTITLNAQQGVTHPPVTTILPTFTPFPPATGASVYRLSPEGAPTEIWSSRTELVYALGVSPSGRILLGTGNNGKVIELENDHVFSNVAKTESAQVTGIAQGPGGRVYLSTANPGKVFVLGPDPSPEGSYESEAFDAEIFSHWGRLAWWGDSGTAAGGKSGTADAAVEFYVRSGNTSNPENNWSAWAGPYTQAGGAKVETPASRFVQWKAVFRGARATSAAVSWVSLSYLPKNVAPVLNEIVLQDPGIRVQGMVVPPQGATPALPVRLQFPSSAAQQTKPFAGTRQIAKNTPKFNAPPQGFSDRGYQSVIWSAEDDNDDELVFSVYYRGEGEKDWKLLKDKLDQPYYSWDTTALADGAYYLKIKASDAPSNPPQDALTAQLESDRFEIDNTPPVISGLAAAAGSPEVRARFEARDSASNVARAEFSLDAGDWTPVNPEGDLSDAHQESYTIVLKGLAPGEHTLAVRVFDQYENGATAKVTFSVAAAKR